MIHSVAFKDGKATYRNKFVRTDKFNLEEKAGKSWIVGLGNVAHDPLFVVKVVWQTISRLAIPPLNVANTSIVVFNDRLLALCEIASPTQLTSDLTTIGEFNWDGEWKKPVTGMPRPFQMLAFAKITFQPTLNLIKSLEKWFSLE